LLYIVVIKRKLYGQSAEFYTVLQQVVQTYIVIIGLYEMVLLAMRCCLYL